MTEHDLPMLHDWLNRPHIEWWGGEDERPTLDDVREHYLPRVLSEQCVTPYIAMLGDEPIGYAQSYVALGSGNGWWEDETDPGARGVDQSLANPAQLGRGLGTRLVRALVELLFSDPAVTKIQTDPAPNNRRAIRCYEKAGFVQQTVITTPDGPAVYMIQTRQSFESTRSAAMYAIKTEIRDLGADSWTFRDQKTMYAGKHITKGDQIYVFASENEGGPGLIACGIVTSVRATPRIAGAERQTPRVSITVSRTGQARRRLGRDELKPFGRWTDGRPETELNFKFYRQATNKIVGLSEKAAAYLGTFFQSA